MESDRSGRLPFTEQSTKSGRPGLHYFGAGALRNQFPLENPLLFFRILTFLFSLASVLVMAFDTHSVEGAHGRNVTWHHFDAYRYVVAGNAVICIYSLAEVCLRVWTLLNGRSLMAHSVAVWFEYSHDQVFAYLLFSASSAGTELAKNLSTRSIHIFSSYTCHHVANFCAQAQVAIGISFLASIFIAICAVCSGFRLATWLIGS